MDMLNKGIQQLGYLFYIVSPNGTSFETIETVPDYITEVIPLFIGLIIIEQLIALYKGITVLRINDAITSLSQGLLMELSKVLFRSATIVYYIYIYENLRVLTLPWNSLLTWIFALIIVDFIFYWFHRATHEINILWALHQVHHSSEDYNLTTALRQSVLQVYAQLLFYWPMALLIPPSVFLVHNQFNVIYQFWIHTQLIKNLGPLELILNTPSHHRVHHGRNRNCIDKNYAGVFIVWDKIFGTFERESEPISFGLTHNIDTFDPLTIQMHHFGHIFDKLNFTKGLTNKLWVLLKGPGWDHGKPRLGLLEDIPNATADMPKYHPNVPFWKNIYTVIHFAILFIIYSKLIDNDEKFFQYKIFLSFIFIFTSLTSFGTIMDKREYGDYFELIRCLFFLMIQNLIFEMPNIISMLIQIVYFMSILIWCFVLLNKITVFNVFQNSNYKTHVLQ